MIYSHEKQLLSHISDLSSGDKLKM